jgi:phospholipid-translocating ATPase
VYRIFLRSLHPKRAFPWLLLSTYSSAATVITIDGLILNTFESGLTSLILGFLLILVYYCSGAFFRHAVFATAVIILPWAAIALSMYQVALVVFFLLYAVQHCLCIYQQERDQRAFFNLSKLAKREIEKTERLLTQMMPLHAYESLKREQWSTDRLNDVTLLYADISGFTAWSSCHTPQEVIDKLSKIFTAFDGVCVAKGVYKVHTIGDCYVILGFSDLGDESKRDVVQECTNMINMGLSMIKTIRRINTEKKTDLNMRIGLHTGKISAGITGINIVRYDIYGPDVDIANKMESSGMKGRLHVSEETKKLIQEGNPERFEFEFDKEVLYQPTDTKVMTYFVNPLQPGDIE